MSTKKIVIGPGSTTGSINQVETMTNSLNNSQNNTSTAAIPEDIKKILEELSAAVSDMKKHLPPQQAAIVDGHLEALKDAAKSKKPEQKWYEVSAKGLIEAATAVGQAAAPVIPIVGSLVTLLKGLTLKGS